MRSQLLQAKLRENDLVAEKQEVEKKMMDLNVQLQTVRLQKN